MDIEKELQQLKAKVSELEKSFKKSNSLFGSSYNTVGSSSSDYLIKTRGKVKIQYGSTFIDLIKDGKINVDGCIYKQDFVGSSDGIYVVGDDVTLVVKGVQIPLAGTSGISYVSFLSPQEATSEQKLQAQQNIGLVVNSVSTIDNTFPDSLIYCSGDKKLYVIQGGQVYDFTAYLPTPYTKSITINTGGGTLQLQSGEIDSAGALSIKVNNTQVINFGTEIICSVPLVVSQLKSPNQEFKLSVREDNSSELKVSTATIDDLIVTGSITGVSTLPTASIVQYYGDISQCPDGWLVCDGSNSQTPDLSAQFIVDTDKSSEGSTVYLLIYIMKDY